MISVLKIHTARELRGRRVPQRACGEEGPRTFRPTETRAGRSCGRRGRERGSGPARSSRVVQARAPGGSQRHPAGGLRGSRAPRGPKRGLGGGSSRRPRAPAPPRRPHPPGTHVAAAHGHGQVAQVRRGPHPQEQRVRQPHDVEVDQLLPQPGAEVVQGDVPAGGGNQPLHAAPRLPALHPGPRRCRPSQTRWSEHRDTERASAFGPGGAGMRGVVGEGRGEGRDRGGAG